MKEGLKQKVVFKDAGKEKIVIGEIYDEDPFIKVVCHDGTILRINKNVIVFMKEGY